MVFNLFIWQPRILWYLRRYHISKISNWTSSLFTQPKGKSRFFFFFSQWRRWILGSSWIPSMLLLPLAFRSKNQIKGYWRRRRNGKLGPQANKPAIHSSTIGLNNYCVHPQHVVDQASQVASSMNVGPVWRSASGTHLCFLEYPASWVQIGHVPSKFDHQRSSWASFREKKSSFC